MAPHRRDERVELDPRAACAARPRPRKSRWRRRGRWCRGSARHTFLPPPASRPACPDRDAQPAVDADQTGRGLPRPAPAFDLFAAFVGHRDSSSNEHRHHAATTATCAVVDCAKTAYTLRSSDVDSLGSMKRKVAVMFLGAALAAVVSFVGAGGCDEVQNTFNCADLCNRYQIVSISAYDTGARARIDARIWRTTARTSTSARTAARTASTTTRASTRRSTAPTARASFPSDPPGASSKLCLSRCQDRIADPQDPDPRVGEVDISTTTVASRTGITNMPSRLHLGLQRRSRSRSSPSRRRSPG